MNLKKSFENPDREYSLAPFWFWNDELNTEHLEMQLKEMHDKGVYEFNIHSRKGVKVKYLSDEWFDRVAFVLDKAAELGMKAWIYDEDNWPSGYAGGKVVESNPDFKAKCLKVETIYPVIGETIVISPEDGNEIVSAVAVWKNGTRFEDIIKDKNTESIRWTANEYFWVVYVFRQYYGAHKPAYSNEKYVDLLNRNVTEKFIELTYKKYKKRFPDHWGKTIKGFFTDEPGFYNNFHERNTDISTIPWTNEFPQYFKCKKNYDICIYLPAIWFDMGDIARKARCDYYEVLAQMYTENFFKPIYDFCVENHVEFTGHVLVEENLRHIVRMQGHYFQTMRYLTVPGIDKISRDRNRITEKLCSSAAHMFGRKRVMSETYACSSWDLTLEEMKAVADWQYVQGINMMIPHAFYSSVEGERKQESPPSEFYQNHYWKYFKKYSDYITRLSYILTAGYHVCNTLVYYPITSCWERITPLNNTFVDNIDKELKNLSLGLLRKQIDFDFIDDYAISERTKLKNNKLIVNQEEYKVVIVPPVTNLPLQTAELLCRFAEDGGILISIGGIPGISTNPLEDFEVKALADRIKKGSKFYELEDVNIYKIFSLYKNQDLLDLELEREDEGIKYLHRRHEDGWDIFFIINENEKEASHNMKLGCCGEVEEWDAETGKFKKLDSENCNGWTDLKIDLDGYGSKLFVIGKNEIRLDGMWSLEIDGETISTGCMPWNELGYGNYSGYGTYTKEFEVHKDDFDRVILDLGEVKESAEVYLNGELVDIRVWRPYKFDITHMLVRGKNILKVIVVNTMANEYEGRELISGLLGPAKIRFME